MLRNFYPFTDPLLSYSKKSYDDFFETPEMKKVDLHKIEYDDP